ncbi:MAG: hypothetical protein DAHOPDDO_00848 [Ignavibacteriaceae bacterium]|nr:hypothetical protein [Ignavibacteriaceae bacterium]
MSYFAILFKLKSSQKIFLKKLFPPNLVEKSVAIYGKCGNVRIRAKIKGIFAILENKVWRKVWQS